MRTRWWWEQVHQNLVAFCATLLKTEADKVFLKNVSDWLYSFSNEIENEEEEVYSMKCLVKHINDVKGLDSVNTPLVLKCSEYVRTKFAKDLWRMSGRHYLYVAAGHEITNSFSESENASLYKDVQGPSANNKLHTATDKIVKHTDKRLNNIMSNVDSESSRTVVFNEGVKLTPLQVAESTLSKSVVAHMREKALLQYVLADGYKTYCESSGDCEKNKSYHCYYRGHWFHGVLVYHLWLWFLLAAQVCMSACLLYFG